MRAPAESTSQNTGSSCLSAYSVSRTIFSTVRAPHEPAFTVGSLAITHTGRPSTRPTPVTTPSAGRSPAMALASRASSTNEPSSSSSASRSRTNSLCWPASLSPSLSRLPSSARSAAAAISARVVPSRSRLSTRRMARMAMSSVIGALAKSRAASSSDLHSTSGSTPGSRRRNWAMRSSPKSCLAVAGLGQAVGVEQQEVALVEVDLPADSTPALGSSSSSGPVARSGCTSRSCHSHAAGWPAEA